MQKPAASASLKTSETTDDTLAKVCLILQSESVEFNNPNGNLVPMGKGQSVGLKYDWAPVSIKGCDVTDISEHLTAVLWRISLPKQEGTNQNQKDLKQNQKPVKDTLIYHVVAS